MPNPLTPGGLTSLRDVTIIDAATLLAGPLAASLLGDLGANVIKVEQPHVGDPLRGYPPFKDGISLIHKVTNRNKRAVTLDLGESRGREVFVDLVRKSDVVIVNFRPQTLQRWDITYDRLSAINRNLIVLMVSAFGATGPYRNRPGFARIAEAFSGFTHVTGTPEGPPVLAGYPIVDAVTGLFGSFSILAALRERDSLGRGACIDLALYEPLLRLMEDIVIPVPFGSARGPNGNANPFVAPNDLFRTKDGEYVVLPISTDQMFARLTAAISRQDLLTKFPTNASRVESREYVDQAVREFTGQRTAAEVLQILIASEVPVGRINSPVDLLEEPHLRERGNFVDIFDEECDTKLTMQAPLPLGYGTVKFPGRSLGHDNDYVYRTLLGYSDNVIRALIHDEII